MSHKTLRGNGHYVWPVHALVCAATTTISIPYDVLDGAINQAKDKDEIVDREGRYSSAAVEGVCIDFVTFLIHDFFRGGVQLELH